MRTLIHREGDQHCCAEGLGSLGVGFRRGENNSWHTVPMGGLAATIIQTHKIYELGHFQNWMCPSEGGCDETRLLSERPPSAHFGWETLIGGRHPHPAGGGGSFEQIK